MEVSGPRGPVGWLDGRGGAESNGPVLAQAHRSAPTAWQAKLPGGRWAAARQLHDGRVVIRASCELAVEDARFMLALDDDTSEFHRLHARDPLIGPTVQRLPRDAHTAQGDRDPRGDPRRVRAADPGVACAPDRARDHPRVRRGSAVARRARRPFSGAHRRVRARRRPRGHAHAARPNDRSRRAPRRRPRARAARAASAASGRGRSASSRCKDSAATTPGSSTTSRS